ncbi:unnamed protein product [Ectocarpus sp. 12 AP-2014]
MKRPSALILYVALGGSLPLKGCARGFGRRLLMQGRTAADEWEASTRQGILESATIEAGRESQESHPLRTQDWTLQASTFTQASIRSSPWTRREQEVTFHRNGTMSSNDGNKGEWWFDVGGLYWDVNTTIRAAPTVLHHKAELHWNVFGSQPRMFRGTITRDRLPNSPLPPWLFRPVVGSFIGSGVGDDTADTSYRHRQTGTSEQPSPPPPRRTDRY